jgi:hypothetical protein
LKRHTLIVCALAVAFAAEPNLRAINYPDYDPAGNRTRTSECPSNDGKNYLLPVTVDLLPPPQPGQGILATLSNSGWFPGWTFQAGAPLNGTMTIEEYYSAFWGTHYSGACITAIYKPDPSDPPTLRWVQLVDTSAPINGYETRYIDQPTNPANPPLPFYYNEAIYHGCWTYRNLYFHDASRRHHPPTSGVRWKGTFYLVDWDGNTTNGTVTVHDGIGWGWVGHCEAPGDTAIPLTLLMDNPPSLGVLTWPTNSPGTNLPAWRPQSSTNLGDPCAWSDVTNGVTQTNNVFQLVVPTAQPQEFFRLALDTIPLVPGPVPAYVAVPPASNIVAQGDEALLFVRADGDDPIAYQWLFNGSPIPNATNDILDFPQVQLTNQGLYSVIVSNASGSDLSVPALLQVQVPYATNYIVDQFNPLGYGPPNSYVGTNNYAIGQITNVWWNWFGGAFSNLVWDPSNDAKGDPNSGSMKIIANFPGQYVQGLYVVWDVGPGNNYAGISPTLNGCNLTSFQCDVRFDPSSATTFNGSTTTYGHLKFGTLTASYGQDFFGAVEIPAGTTSWVHVNIPINVANDTNLASISGVLISLDGNWYPARLNGPSILWVDNIEFVGMTTGP